MIYDHARKNSKKPTPYFQPKQTDAEHPETYLDFGILH